MNFHTYKTLLGMLPILACSLTTAYGAGFDDMVKQATESLKQYATDGQSENDKAQQNTNTDNTGSQDEKEISVEEALKKIKFVSGKAKPGVDFYIYLYSRGGCCACETLIPRVVEVYNKEISQEPRVELILISSGEKPDVVKSYVNKHKGEFPALWQGNCKKQPLKDLPGHYAPHFIPTATFVDKMGNVIVSLPGDAVLEWKKYTIDPDAEK